MKNSWTLFCLEKIIDFPERLHTQFHKAVLGTNLIIPLKYFIPKNILFPFLLTTYFSVSKLNKPQSIKKNEMKFNMEINCLSYPQWRCRNNLIDWSVIIKHYYSIFLQVICSIFDTVSSDNCFPCKLKYCFSLWILGVFVMGGMWNLWKLILRDL